MPAVFSECPSCDCGLIDGEMNYVFSPFDLHDEGLDVNTLLPQSGGYLARQSGAFAELKPKLFQLLHDLTTLVNVAISAVPVATNTFLRREGSFEVGQFGDAQDRLGCCAVTKSLLKQMQSDCQSKSATAIPLTAIRKLDAAPSSGRSSGRISPQWWLRARNCQFRIVEQFQTFNYKIY